MASSSVSESLVLVIAWDCWLARVALLLCEGNSMALRQQLGRLEHLLESGVSNLSCFFLQARLTLCSLLPYNPRSKSDTVAETFMVTEQETRFRRSQY